MSDDGCQHVIAGGALGKCMEPARYGEYCGIHRYLHQAKPSPTPCPGINPRGYLAMANHCPGCAPGGLTEEERGVVEEYRKLCEQFRDYGDGTDRKIIAIIDRLTGDR